MRIFIGAIVGATALMSAQSAVSQAAGVPSSKSSPPILPSNYQLICQATISNGLNWNGAAWVAARFVEKTHLIAVGGENICFPPAGTSKAREVSEGALYTREACVNERDVGAPYLKFASENCSEYYSYRGGKWETSVSCRSNYLTMEATPDGEYHLSYIHGSLNENQLKKDSMFVEAGKCSLVK